MNRSVLLGLIALFASSSVLAEDERCILVSKIGIADDQAFEVRLELVSRSTTDKLRVVLPSSALDRLHSSVWSAKKAHEKKSGEGVFAFEKPVQLRIDDFDSKTPEYFANAIESEVSDGETILTFSHVRQAKGRMPRSTRVGCAILVPDKVATLEHALGEAQKRHQSLMEVRRPLSSR